jgi:hypothetical protein
MSDMYNANDFDFTTATPAEIVTFVAEQMSKAEDRTIDQLDLVGIAEDFAGWDKRVDDLLKKRTNITQGLLAARAELRASRNIFADALSAAIGANVSLERLVEVTKLKKSTLLRLMGRHQSNSEDANGSSAEQSE